LFKTERTTPRLNLNSRCSVATRASASMMRNMFCAQLINGVEYGLSFLLTGSDTPPTKAAGYSP
jgi:hypothetical protein